MRRVIYFALTVFIGSCGGNPEIKQIEQENLIKTIPIVSKPDSILTKISDIASDIEYIHLQPSGNFQVQWIDKIVQHNDKLYINSIRNILCFDDKGHFLYESYGNKKEKNENVVAIYDFDINARDSSLHVLYGNKILRFKITGSGFEYLKTLKLGKLSPSKLDFVPRCDKILLSSTKVEGFELTLHMLINLSGETLSYKRNYFARFNPSKNGIWDEIIHYQFDNKIYFRERFNDTIFSIDPATNYFTAELILSSKISSTNSENINDPEYYKILPNITNIFETELFLYYSYSFGESDYKIFYAKDENRKFEIDQEKGVLKDDIGGGPDFDPKFCSDDKMYSWISARDFIKYTGSEDFTEAQVQNTKQHVVLKKLANSLKETDNPVLVLVSLKK